MVTCCIHNKHYKTKNNTKHSYFKKNFNTVLVMSVYMFHSVCCKVVWVIISSHLCFLGSFPYCFLSLTYPLLLFLSFGRFTNNLHQQYSWLTSCKEAFFHPHSSTYAIPTYPVLYTQLITYKIRSILYRALLHECFWKLCGYNNQCIVQY